MPLNKELIDFSPSIIIDYLSKEKVKKPSPNLSYKNLVDFIGGTIYLPLKAQDNKVSSKYIRFSVKKKDENLDVHKILFSKLNGDNFYDYTRPLCGCLLEGFDKIINEDKKLYFIHEFCLMFLLNWDMQEQLRKPDTLKDVNDKINASPPRIYSNLKDYLKNEKYIDQISETLFNDMFNAIQDLFELLSMEDIFQKLLKENQSEQSLNKATSRTFKNILKKSQKNPTQD